MNEPVKKSLSGIIGASISTVLGIVNPGNAAVYTIVSPALAESVYWLITEMETKAYSKREKDNFCKIFNLIKPITLNQITNINDDDWFAEYFECAKLANSDSLQFMWAKILESKINGNNFISKRLLSTLKLFTKNDFNLCQKYFCHVLEASNNEYFIPRINDLKFSYVELLDLSEIGIISPDFTLHIDGLLRNNVEFMCMNKERVLVAKKTAENINVSFNIYRLTKLGKELFLMSSVSQDETTIDVLFDSLTKKYKSVNFDIKTIKARFGNAIDC